MIAIVANMSLMTMQTTIGTKEWAETNVNFQTGCNAGCEYCYARLYADKFGWKKWDDWSNSQIREKDLEKNFRKRNGRVMFPSSHNIDFSNATLAFCLLAKLVTAKNNILIVMKPEFSVIEKICSDFKVFRNQIEFRFTITTVSDSQREIFEPNATPIFERMECIELVQENDYRYSISIEPFLDWDPVKLIDHLLWYGVKPPDIWLGSMNHVKALSNKSKVIKEHYDDLVHIYKPSRLFWIKSRLDKRELRINYKDGFLNQMKKR